MKPLLLLIPGMLNDARVWDAVRAELGDSAEFRVADVQRDTSIAGMAQRAWTQTHDVAAERRFVIAGFSMGGYVAQQMLAEPSRRVDALALVSTSGRAESPEAAALREKTIAATARDFARVVEGFIGFGTHPSFQADAAAVQALRTMLLATGSETAIRQHRAILERADCRAQLPHWRLPTCVLVGDEDRVTPPALAEELAALIPAARLERLPECGHMAPLEQPRRVAAALRALLDAPAT